MFWRMRMLIALFEVFVCVAVNAHDVVWPGNPSGFTPQEQLKIPFGTNAVVEVKPVTGEACIVSVTLDPLPSTLVRVEITTDNPARQVNLVVTALRAATDASEIALITGEWHATGSPDPDECTAVKPNRFAVPVKVLGGPPAPSLNDFAPRSASPGSTVTLTGTGFTGTIAVAIGAAPAEFVVVDDRTIRLVVPPGAPVGRLAITTPAGQTLSAGLLAIQPELKVIQGLDRTRVALEWGQREYPFTLQHSSSLADPRWTDLITTLDHRLELPLQNGPSFFRLFWMEIPLDPTDYLRDRPSVARLYQRDPVAYWASFGIPALARLAGIRENVGADPFTAFRGFFAEFDESKFLAALRSNQFPPLVSETVSNQLSAGHSLTNAFAKTLIDLVRTNDLTNCLTVFRTNCFATNSFTPMFAKVLTNGMTTNFWGGVAPATNKFFYATNQFTNFAGPKWVDTHGTHAFTQKPRPATPPVNTNTVNRVKWENITSDTFTNTTYDGACASVAVGASLAKLGLIGNDTSSQFWNDLSRLLGATPGTLGAYATDIAAFYGTLGYGAAQAYDGRFESAVEEAKKALERGCDVALYYYSTDGTRGHTEFVTGINVDSTDSSKATISTLSWSQNATVTYNGSSTGGTFSGKSDGLRYRKSDEAASWLEQSGKAILTYYCKQE